MRRIGILALTLLFPFTALAALININTADTALLQTLPGIGSSKAAAIITYRTEHGSFVRIEDIQNVSGIGPSTFAGMKDLITVGDVVSTSSLATATSTTLSGSGGSTYVPPPSTLSVTLSGPSVAFLNVPLRFTAQATTKGGAIDPNAQITWSFGDGSEQTGTLTEKVYRHLGKYVVTAKATDGPARAGDTVVVAVRPTLVRIGASQEGVTITNASEMQLDLSQWRLHVASSWFRIPEGTEILPQMDVLFPADITHLPISVDAELLFPDGLLAARTHSALVEEGVVQTEVSQTFSATQPFVAASRSNSIQAIEPTPNATPNTQSYDQAVVAPAASSNLAAAGASLSATTTPTASQSQSTNPLRSPWIIGLLGVIVLAGGAFILI